MLAENKPAEQNPIVRFAPSPTGYLHIGNIRTALLNWLFALGGKGQFILRLDDTDQERSRPAYADAIKEDLQWLGIKPQLTFAQSSRIHLYEAAAARLKSAGLLYPCFETEDELNRRRARARALGRPPIYDRAALRLTPEERQKRLDGGEAAHWRFLLPNFDHDPFSLKRSPVEWNDLCRGPQTIDLGSLSDPVLIRADGSFLYTLPSIVDDIDSRVTHVIRGEDHVANTAVQITIFQALGGTIPGFAHHNLLVRADGGGLSKRTGDLSIQKLREATLDPMAVIALAVLSGSRFPVQPVEDMGELSQKLSLHDLSRSPAKFDPQELYNLNARILHHAPYSAVADMLAALGIKEGAAFWHAVRENCRTMADAALWWQIIKNPIPETLAKGLSEDDQDFLALALECFPTPPLDGESWSQWTGALKKQSGRKGRALFLPLRKALTGRDDGPAMAAILPLIGHQAAQDRIASIPSK